MGRGFWTGGGGVVVLRAGRLKTELPGLPRVGVGFWSWAGRMEWLASASIFAKAALDATQRVH